MNQDYKNWIGIFRFLLNIHRMSGLTFGGLIIEGTGRLSVCKQTKYFGYIIAFVVIAYDIQYNIWMVRYFLQIFQQMPRLSEDLGTLFPYITVSITMMVAFLKGSIVLYFNISGYKTIKVFVEDINRREMPSLGLKLSALLVSWFIIGFTVYGISLRTVLNLKGNIQAIVSVLNFIVSATYGTAFSMMIWGISIYYSANLARMTRRLKLVIRLNTGYQ